MSDDLDRLKQLPPDHGIDDIVADLDPYPAMGKFFSGIDEELRDANGKCGKFKIESVDDLDTRR